MNSIKTRKNLAVRIREIEDYATFFSNGLSLKNTCVQHLDLTQFKINWHILDVDQSTCFFGCDLRDEDYLTLIKMKALIFPKIEGLPYSPFRNNLYHWKELNVVRGRISVDQEIYEHFIHFRHNPPANEALYQRIHDHSIDDALRLLLGFDEQGNTEKKCIAIMGGHGTLRTDPFFSKVAFTAKYLTEAGYFIASGGGPGIMEAANLGAYFAGKSDEILIESIKMLGKSPHYTSEAYMERALEILAKYPEGQDSLAIPTWFYGHEPSNLFTPHIAKYFSNSIREDTLLAIAIHGIIFAPGSAGTTQEIFMDAAQNHYHTFKYISPMVFLGRERYTKETQIFPLIENLAKNQQYARSLYLTDEPKEILAFLQEHPPFEP